MSENGLITTNGSAIDFAKKEIVQTLKATVAAGLNDAEFALFAEHCKGTGLNPFKKEVWAIKAGGRLQIMTGLQGYLSIANSHPQFDGMEVEVDDDLNPTKAICRVYRKDRRIPAEGVALMKEYRKETPIWKQMPRVMLTKVAKSIALREAFPQELNGTYTAEEMPPEYANAPAAERPVVVPADQLPAKKGRVAKAAKPSKQTFYYSLAKISEDRRQDALDYLEKYGAALDLDYNVYVYDGEKAIPGAGEMLVPKPETKDEKGAIDQVLGGDDLPEVSI